MASYRDVFRRLRVEKNGAVSDAMTERGLNYGMNYGVSLTTIKDVSAEFGKDHLLAADLWRQEVRELRLAAIYIENPDEVAAEQIEAWGAALETAEVAQVLGRELLWQIQNALNIITKWLTGDNELRHTAACGAVARLASKTQTCELERLPLNKMTAQPLREIFKYHKALRPEIRSLATQVDDLLWQLGEILIDEKN